VLRALVGAVRTVGHLVADERRRYAGRTEVALPVTLLAGVDLDLAHDADSLFRLTVVDSPPEESRRLVSPRQTRPRYEQYES